MKTEKRDICLSPILSPKEVLADEHIQSRQMFLPLTHEKYGSYFGISQPLKFAHSAKMRLGLRLCWAKIQKMQF